MSQILEIEVPMDLWGEELENFQPVKKSRKFYTLALVDAKDRLWEERTVSIKYEIFRGKSPAPRHDGTRPPSTLDSGADGLSSHCRW